jgi:hypothetical protein
MKKLLTTKIFWTLVSCILSFFLFGCLSNILKLSYWEPDKADTLGIYQFQNSPEQPDIVIVGSSRARFGLLPEPMAQEVMATTDTDVDIFNLGQDTGGMRISYAILKNVLRGEKRPRLVLLEIRVWDLNSNSSGVNNAYFKYYANQRDILRSLDKSIFFGGLGPRAQGFLRSISNLLWLAQKNPWQAQYQEKLDLLQENSGAELRYVGSSIAEMSEKKRKRFTSLRFHMLEDLMERFQIKGPAEHAFKDFIALCRRRNIKLILLTMPLHPDDPELNYYRAEHLEFIEYVSEICAREDIRFLNLQEEGPPLGDEHFGDYDHLNVTGAEIVSTYVSKRILVPEVTRWSSPGEKSP